MSHAPSLRRFAGASFSRLCLAAALCVATLAAMPAAAAPVSYTFTGVVEGMLDNQAFSGLLTVTASGDTDDVTSNPAGTRFRNDAVSTVIDIPGFGSFSVTGDDYVFNIQSSDVLGYGVQGIPICCDIIQVDDPAFDAYELTTSIGPIGFPSNPSLPDWVDVPTSGGLLTVTSFADGSFRAVVVDVPEGDALAILAIGLLGLACSRPRRRTA